MFADCEKKTGMCISLHLCIHITFMFACGFVLYKFEKNNNKNIVRTNAMLQTSTIIDPFDIPTNLHTHTHTHTHTQAIQAYVHRHLLKQGGSRTTSVA